MPPLDTTIKRLGQIEQELTTLLSEYPSAIALERLRFVRGLVRFVKTQLEIEDEATIPILDTELPKPGAADTNK